MSDSVARDTSVFRHETVKYGAAAATIRRAPATACSPQLSLKTFRPGEFWPGEFWPGEFWPDEFLPDELWPDELWPDNNGMHINAHGGEFLIDRESYSWFCEHKAHEEIGDTAQPGVNVYSSKDFCNWTDRSIALSVSAGPDRSSLGQFRKWA